MSNNALLSIGIPTYNRADLITELIDDILRQIAADELSRINIFISDNASTDNTQEIVSKYVHQNPNLITYHRNQTNLGFSPNVDSAVRNANGKFVLIMSDDDRLGDYALRDLLSALEEHPDLGLAILSAQTWKKDMSAPCASFSARPNAYYPSGSDYIQATKAFPAALISGYVFNRTKWIDAQPERFFDINSIHFILGPLVMAKSPCYILSAKPYIKYRVDMGHWSIATDPLYPFPMFASYLKGCKAIKGLYPERIHSILYCSTIRTTAGHIIRNKVLGYDFPRKDIYATLAPYLDTGCFKCWLYTKAMKLLMRIPRLLLYVPFRWLVPEKL